MPGFLLGGGACFRVGLWIPAFAGMTGVGGNGGSYGSGGGLVCWRVLGMLLV